MNSSRAGMKTLLGLALLVLPASAFMPKPAAAANKAATWKLRDLIQGEDVDAESFDIGQGGVTLAEESAIKIIGEVKHKPGNADARPIGLLRYNNLKSIDEAKVNDVLNKVGSKVICTGQGVELYVNPGETLDSIVKYAPMEAVKDAFNGAASAIECETLVFNFLGSDDLMMGEVLDAVNEITVMLDIATKAKISFNSMCHSSIPMGTCGFTVVAIGSEEAEFSGLEKSVAAGEVYVRDGAWYTVEEADINTAVA